MPMAVNTTAQRGLFRRARRANTATEAVRARNKLHPHAVDYSILFLVLFLVGFGLIVLYSTSSYRSAIVYNDPAFMLKKQLRNVAVGLVGMYFMTKCDYHWWRKGFIIWPMYLGIVGLLGLTLVFSIALNGAQRWIGANGATIQPSEFAKIALILFLADYIATHSNEMQRWQGLIKPLVPTGLIIGLVGVENMSTALILLAITFGMLFVANPRFIPFFGVIAVGGVGGAALLFSRAYRMTRITTWLDPEHSEAGEQTMKGLYAIGSGGLFGKGLGQSMQKMILPEAYNDMIFSIITEELGLFGAVAVILLFLTLLWKLMVVALNARELYGSMILVGVIVHIGAQVFINIAVATNTMPNTGIPLPFISYGGSSLVSILVEMGIVLSVSKYLRIERPEEERRRGDFS